MAILDNNNWRNFHVDPWWISHRDLPYINEPFNDSDSLKKWRELGYTQTRFTGDMYDMRNPEPDWIAPFRRRFLWQHFSWSIYRMGPGTVLPNHSDTFARFVDIYRIKRPQTVCRAVIFLEDWASGHYFEIDGNPIVNWRAGDGVAWRYDTLHLAANVGETDRYTLQITGVVDENTQF
jgi:hypothetical protein